MLPAPNTDMLPFPCAVPFLRVGSFVQINLKENSNDQK